MRGKETALFIMIIAMLLSAGCRGGTSVVPETPVPTETAVPTAIAPELPPAADLLELSGPGIDGLLPGIAPGTADDEGNFCLADETAAADQDCDPASAESIVPEPLKSDASGMEKELLPDYTMPDLAGTDVRLGDMILGNRVTMLNVWGISCGPCMTEMPELTAIRKEFAPQGLEIIGLAADLLDASGKIDPALAEEAQTVVADLGVDYPILAMTKDIRDRMGIFATPTTFLVDRNGTMIGEAVMGTRSTAEWKRIITEALLKAE